MQQLADEGLVRDNQTLADMLTVQELDGGYRTRLTVYRASTNQAMILRQLTLLLFPDYSKNGGEALPFTDTEFRDRLIAAIGGMSLVPPPAPAP